MKRLDRRNWLLLIGFALMSIAAFKYAVKPTLRAYDQYSSLLNSREDENFVKLVARIKEQENQLIKIHENGPENQISLLNKVAAFCSINGLYIINFSEPVEITEENLKSTYVRFGVEGSFKNILLLINHIENSQSSKIIHLKFKKKVVNRQTKLECQMVSKSST